MSERLAGMQGALFGAPTLSEATPASILTYTAPREASRWGSSVVNGPNLLIPRRPDRQLTLIGHPKPERARPGDSLAKILSHVSSHIESTQVSPASAVEKVMGSTERAAELWPTVSGYQSSIPLESEDGPSHQSLLAKAADLPGPIEGNAAKLFVLEELRRAEEAREKARKEAAKGSKDLHVATASDPAVVLEVVDSVLEQAEIRAVAKKAKRVKPEDEDITWLEGQGTPGVMDQSIRNRRGVVRIPDESNSTAEIVTAGGLTVVDVIPALDKETDQNGGFFVGDFTDELTRRDVKDLEDASGHGKVRQYDSSLVVVSFPLQKA